MPRYLFRLICYSVLIGPIPVICLGLFSLSISSKDLEARVKEGNRQVLVQSQMRIEQMMQTLELSAIQLANSSPVKRSESEDLQPDQFLKIHELWNGLYNLQTFVDIRKSYLINLEQDWLLESSSSVKYEPFTSSPLRDQFLKYSLLRENVEWVTNSPASDSIHLVLKLPLINPKAQPKQLLIIEIGKENISRLLVNDHPETYYILDRSGSDFLRAGGAKYQTVNEQVLSALALNGGRGGFFKADLESGEETVSYIVSPRYGWIYVSTVSIDVFTKESRQLIVGSFLVYLLIITIVAVVAIQGSRNMYRPIRKLYKAASDLNSQDPKHKKTKDELTIIGEQLQRLFSTEQQLQQQVKGQLTALKEFFMLKLFTGQMPQADIVKRAEGYGFPSSWRLLGVIALQIDTLEGTKYQENDRDLLMFAINNMIGDLIPVHLRFTPILLDHQTQVTLLASDLNSEEEMKRFMYGLSESVQRRLKELLGIQVSIGISKPMTAYSEAPAAYHQCLEALRCRISLGNELIMSYEEIETSKQIARDAFMHVRALEDQIIYAFKTADQAQLTESFQQYISCLVGNHFHNKEVPFLLLQLISRVVQVVQENGGSASSLFTDRITLESVMKIHTKEEVIHYFQSELFEPVMSFLNEQNEYQHDKITDKIIGLIEERYDQDLTLELCASILNYHPGYISRVFKKEAGVPFVDYLTDYRMKMARTMLENSTMKISDIAEKLRYAHTSAFIRAFRKCVGQTPGQYREQLLEKM
jgi:two-component system, response regulator YesN